jgi:hypothetical protein
MTAIRSRLIVAMTAVTVAAAVSVGWQAYSISRAALETESFNKLIAVRELKADQVDAFFRTIRNQVIAMSANRMVTGPSRSPFVLCPGISRAGRSRQSAGGERGRFVAG